MRPALAILLSLVFAAPASASTARVFPVYSCQGDLACIKYSAGYDIPVVTYVAAPGEGNRLTVGRSGDQWTLADPAAAITAGDGCRAVDLHTAVCTAAAGPEPIPRLSAQLGDGDDAVTLTGALGVRTSVAGGDGADVLTGGAQDDTLDGGPGADRIDGAGGEDTLSFAGRRDGVTVEVEASRTSDGDAFSGIEAIQGGDGADRLLGGAGADTLLGGRGADVLRGAGGEDTLTGELGADRIDGGPGDDHLSGDPDQGDDGYEPIIRLHPDVLRGGEGDDEVWDSGGANRLAGGRGDDHLVGGENRDRLSGGPGNDWLEADGTAYSALARGAADRLDGGAGRDRLDGEVGADRLRGGPGADRLFGGSGADRLLARDRFADRADCGRARDRATIDAKDSVRACEIRRFPSYTASR